MQQRGRDQIRRIPAVVELLRGRGSGLGRVVRDGHDHLGQPWERKAVGASLPGGSQFSLDGTVHNATLLG